MTEAPEAEPPRHVVRIVRKDGTVSTFTSTRRQATRARKYEDAPPVAEVSQTGMPDPVTPEAFAALVAALRKELAAARPIDRERLIRRTMTPECFTGRPWAWSCITLAEAAPLTGRKLGSLRAYAKPNETGPARAARNGPAGREFPEPASMGEAGGEGRSPARLWEVGALGLWCARRSEKRSQAAITKAAANPLQQPWRPVKEGPKAGPKRDGTWGRSLPRRRIAAVAFLRALVREDTAITLERATERIGAAGLDLAGVDLAAAYMEARQQETASFIARLRDGSVHPEGLVTAAEVSAVFGIKRPSVMRALERGELVAAGTGTRGPLFDPERLRTRTRRTAQWGDKRITAQYSRMPADKDWAGAAPMP